MNQPTVTIGVLHRERFHLAARVLKAIYKHTHIPFNLVFVDCNMPAKYLNQVKKVLDTKSRVKIIHTDKYIQPNEARNLILRESQDDYVALIESDCFVSENWLSKMITACEEHSAMVAIPLLLEGATWHKKVHHDRKIVNIRSFEKDGKTFYEFLAEHCLNKLYYEKDPRKILSIETHFMLFRRKVFDIIGLFDEQLNTREPVDVSLALYKANVPIILAPDVHVNFYNPPPVYKSELPFYKFVWDLERGLETYEYLDKKWNIVNMPNVMDFMKDQHYRTSYPRWLLYKGPKRISRIFKRIASKIF